MRATTTAALTASCALSTLSISPDVNDPGFRNIGFDELVTTYADGARGLLAMRKAGVRSKREAVEIALRKYVDDTELDHASLLALFGSGGVADGYDPKAAAPDPWAETS